MQPSPSPESSKPSESSEPRDPPASDTADLLAATRSGSQPALATLLERNLPRLRAFVRLHVDALLRERESCSDLVQSVCGEILQYADGIEYRGETEFLHMLYVAVLNKVRKRRRFYLAEKRHPRREVGEVDDRELVDAYRQVCTPSQHAIGRETVQLLERAFDRLPEHYRDVVTLGKVVGLSQEQLAAAMGRTVPSVRNLLHRALAQLADAMVDVQRER